MKQFIRQISIFSLTTILVITILQLTLDFKVKGETINGHDNLDNTANANAELVFLGSSRCWTHFDPEFFQKTFHVKSVNIGMDGHSEISMMIIRLATYLSTNQNPKFVIINFDPLVTAGSFTDNNNLIQKDKYARYAFMPAEKNRAIVNYFKFDNKDQFIPLHALFKYSSINDYLLRQNISTYAKFGYERHDEKWDTVLKPVNSTLKHRFFDDSQMPLIISMLDSLNRMCVANHGKLLCIQTPFYRSLWDSTAFERTKKVCERLNIPFIDANIATIADSMECFYNTDHMNTNGVKKLNDFLAQDSTLHSFLN
jgi:hypothetical protein